MKGKKKDNLSSVRRIASWHVFKQMKSEGISLSIL